MNKGNVLFEKTMADGRALRVLRYVSPEDEVPERVVRYVIGSLGFDSYNKYIQAQAYWRSWYRESFEGKLGGVASHLYLAEVDGVLAARVWFAYSRGNGFGNFGNVYTETDYRRLGLMTELLAPCMADFDAADDARILCCASGNRAAVRAYLKHGFRLTYGGEAGRLERTRRPGADPRDGGRIPPRARHGAFLPRLPGGRRENRRRDIRRRAPHRRNRPRGVFLDLIHQPSKEHLTWATW